MIKKIAVLLTCFNRKKKTITCLEALFSAQLPPEHKLNVFLVDDGSNDGTGEAVKKNYPQVNVIPGNGNLFWNRGMHLAWETATQNNDYDFYLWLNDDTVLFPNALDTVLKNAEMKANKAIICGTTLSNDLKKYTYGGKSLSLNLISPKKPIQECHIINGNFVLIPREVYKEVGLIDPIFRHSIGDHDYGLRANKFGFRSYVASKAIGTCERHDKLAKWCLPETKLPDRIKSLYSPLGNSHPYYFFIYEKRHFGISVAIKHFITIHTRLLFPSLWKQ